MDFERLYTEYFQAVYGYVLSVSHDRVLAEELTQETFFKALKKIDSFKEGTNVKAWLCQIAKNLHYDHYRGKKHAADNDDVIDDLVLEIDSDVEASFAKKELTGAIHRILHKMDEPYKEVFSLRVFGELSFSDIGELFSRSDGWARVTYHRAKSKIREELENEN